jgi:hypothetical protein
MDSLTEDHRMDIASNDNLETMWQKQMVEAGSVQSGTKRKHDDLESVVVDDASDSDECDSEPDSEAEGVLVVASSHAALPSVSTQAPKRKRRKKTRKYVTFCKKMDIPYPNVHRRESEHLDTCQTCQEAWPLFFYQQHHEMKISFEEVSKAWMEMPESERQRKHKVLAKAEVAWLKGLVKTRPPTGYQIFLKEKRKGNADLQKINFGDCTKIIARLWGGLTAVEKKTYTDFSLKFKQERRAFIEALPSFKRKRYEAEKKKFKSSLKSKRPPKPCNSFMLYLSDRWQEAKTRGTSLKYRDMMKIASQEWESKLTEKDKVPYRLRFAEAKEKYFISKQKMKDKRKMLQNKKRAQKSASTLQVELPMGQPIDLHHGGTDDEMSS